MRLPCESTEKLNRDMPYSLCALCLCVFVVKLNFNRIRYTTVNSHYSDWAARHSDMVLLPLLLLKWLHKSCKFSM